MTRLRLHQPVEGRAAGEIADVPAGRADWMLANGYASLAGDDTDSTDGEGELQRGVSDASNDPTLAANREAPDDEDGNPLVPTTEDPTVVFKEDLGSVQDFSGAPTRLFDPREHSVKDVLAHLAAHPQDAGRVHGLETGVDGKSRAGILKSGVNFGPQEIPEDGGAEPRPVNAELVGPDAPSADTLAGREPLVPNDPEPGDPATTETPGDTRNDEPEEGVVVRNPALGTAF